MLRPTLALAAVVVVAVAVAGSWTTPSDAQSACVATNARFATVDGVRLHGAMLGRGTTGVVFAHQVAGDRCQRRGTASTSSRFPP